MNNDYYKKYRKDSDSQDTLKNQQFFPGGFPTPPGGQPPNRPGGPGGQPPNRPGGPGGQPRTAPPNFTPQLPRMDDQPSGFAPQFGGPDTRDGQDRGRGRDFGGFFRQPRNFRACMNQFTFIWLFNGNNFWFFPINRRGQFIEGFRWRRNRWEYERININRILFFQCF
ncbi:MAG TPA: hypothetical protein VJ888_10380 [Mobilitalea sp.]|nr:hypothetical protein [Mobilitalea sp.]